VASIIPLRQLSVTAPTNTVTGFDSLGYLICNSIDFFLTGSAGKSRVLKYRHQLTCVYMASHSLSEHMVLYFSLFHKWSSLDIQCKKQ